jgi:hypothetical protein
MLENEIAEIFAARIDGNVVALRIREHTYSVCDIRLVHFDETKDIRRYACNVNGKRTEIAINCGRTPPVFSIESEGNLDIDHDIQHKIVETFTHVEHSRLLRGGEEGAEAKSAIRA